MTKTSKRSSYVKLSLLGAAAFSLAACKQEPPVDAVMFPSVAECQSAATQPAATISAADCEKAFAEAQAEHERTAPKYDEAKLCEEEHGGSCYAQPNPNGGGGSVFLPLMAGMMLGNMMSGGSSMGRSYSHSQPMFQTKDKRYGTAGGAFFSSNSGAAKVKPASFAAAKTTSASAPMTRASVAKTGGFGRSATASAGRSSFGG